MSNVIRGNFPEHHRSIGEYADIIDGRFLIGPIKRTGDVIFGAKNQDQAYKSIVILNTINNEQANIQIEHDTLNIYAPLAWLNSISGMAQSEGGRNFAELVQTHILSSIYANKWINQLDNNKYKKRILNFEPTTSYMVDGSRIDIGDRDALDLAMWSAASAISLKAITQRGGNDRKHLLAFLNAQYEIEIGVELQQQKFRAHKHYLKKLTKINHKYWLDGFRVGCFDPMSDEGLQVLSPDFLRAANR